MKRALTFLAALFAACIAQAQLSVGMNSSYGFDYVRFEFSIANAQPNDSFTAEYFIDSLAIHEVAGLTHTLDGLPQGLEAPARVVITETGSGENFVWTGMVHTKRADPHFPLIFSTTHLDGKRYQFAGGYTSKEEVSWYYWLLTRPSAAPYSWIWESTPVQRGPAEDIDLVEIHDLYGYLEYPGTYELQLVAYSQFAGRDTSLPFAIVVEDEATGIAEANPSGIMHAFGSWLTMGNDRPATLRIVSLNGQEVFNRKVEPGERVSVAELPNAPYVAMIEGARGALKFYKAQ